MLDLRRSPRSVEVGRQLGGRLDDGFGIGRDVGLNSGMGVGFGFSVPMDLAAAMPSAQVPEKADTDAAAISELRAKLREKDSALQGAVRRLNVLREQQASAPAVDPSAVVNNGDGRALADLTRRLDAQTGELATARGTIAQLQRDLTATTTELTGARVEIATLRAAEATALHDNDEDAVPHTALHRLRSDDFGYLGRSVRVTPQVRRLRDRVDALERGEEELRDINIACNTTIDSLKAEIGSLQDEIEQKKSTIRIQASRIEQIERQRAQYRSELEQCKSENRALNAKVADHTTQIRSKDGELQEAMDMAKQLHTHPNGNVSLKEHLSHASTHVRSLWTTRTTARTLALDVLFGTLSVKSDRDALHAERDTDADLLLPRARTEIGRILKIIKNARKWACVKLGQTVDDDEDLMKKLHAIHLEQVNFTNLKADLERARNEVKHAGKWLEKELQLNAPPTADLEGWFITVDTKRAEQRSLPPSSSARPGLQEPHQASPSSPSNEPSELAHAQMELATWLKNLLVAQKKKSLLDLQNHKVAELKEDFEHFWGEVHSDLESECRKNVESTTVIEDAKQHASSLIPAHMQEGVQQAIGAQGWAWPNDVTLKWLLEALDKATTQDRIDRDAKLEACREKLAKCTAARTEQTVKQEQIEKRMDVIRKEGCSHVRHWEQFYDQRCRELESKAAALKSEPASGIQSPGSAHMSAADVGSQNDGHPPGSMNLDSPDRAAPDAASAASTAMGNLSDGDSAAGLYHSAAASANAPGDLPPYISSSNSSSGPPSRGHAGTSSRGPDDPPSGHAGLLALAASQVAQGAAIASSSGSVSPSRTAAVSGHPGQTLSQAHSSHSSGRQNLPAPWPPQPNTNASGANSLSAFSGHPGQTTSQALSSEVTSMRPSHSSGTQNLPAPWPRQPDTNESRANSPSAASGQRGETVSQAFSSQGTPRSGTPPPSAAYPASASAVQPGRSSETPSFRGPKFWHANATFAQATAGNTQAQADSISASGQSGSVAQPDTNASGANSPLAVSGHPNETGSQAPGSRGTPTIGHTTITRDEAETSSLRSDAPSPSSRYPASAAQPGETSVGGPAADAGQHGVSGQGASADAGQGTGQGTGRRTNPARAAKGKPRKKLDL